MRSVLICLALALVSVSPAQSVRLQLKFRKGSVDRMSTKMHMTETIAPSGGQKMTIGMNQSTSMLMRILEANATRNVMRMTYERMSSATTMNGKPVPQQADVDKLLRGQSITISFAPNGRVLDVQGLDQLIAKSMQGQPPQMQQAFKQMFNKDAISRMWQMMFGGAIPNHPVRVGESWPTQFVMGDPPIRIHLNMTTTLKGVERRAGHQVAKLALGGTGTFDLSGLVGPGMVFKTRRLAISGTSLFDLDRGWVTDQDFRMQVLGTMTMTQEGKTQSAELGMDMVMGTKMTPVR